MDAIALESQFLDHLAPVWVPLPASARGRLLVERSLLKRARAKGIDSEPLDIAPLMRATPTAPKPKPGPGPVLLTASAGDIKIGRRLGYRSFVFLEHGAGQSYGGKRNDIRHGSYAGGPDREDVGLFLVPNEQCAARWRDAYPDARVEIVGCPKLDGLPRREYGSYPVVAISFHWDGPNLPYAGTALLDYLSVLPELARRFTTIGHCHPKGDWPAQMQAHYARAGIRFVPDFEDVCRQADVYVADNTSTLPEFASTGRPVVLLNARHWHRKGSVGGRFWDWAGIGINVSPDDDLIAAIEEALRDAPARRTAREAALDIVYPIRRGGAELAAAAIVDWLAGKEARAA